MADCAVLLRRCPERGRGFESHPLRHFDAVIGSVHGISEIIDHREQLGSANLARNANWSLPGFRRLWGLSFGIRGRGATIRRDSSAFIPQARIMEWTWILIGTAAGAVVMFF